MIRTTESKKVAASLRELLSRLIDYAGLFPPALLDMQTAVANYDKYRNGDHAWMLGRFILPASRFGDFEEAIGHARTAGFTLSAVVTDIEKDVPVFSDFNLRHTGNCLIDTIELKATSAEEISRTQALISSTAYFEVAPSRTTQLLPAIRDLGVRAKIRTGGTTLEMFPSSAAIAQFILDCLDAKVPFKATAGLHHPVRCTKPLTYEADAPKGTMHGFLNVFTAAVLARSGGTRHELIEVLNCGDPTAFKFTEDGLQWRDRSVSVDQIADSRRHFAISFGSCSFEEPVLELQQLGLL